MEIIIVAAAVLGLLFLLGVSVGTLIAIVIIILSVLTSLTLLFFAFCGVLLLFCSQKYEAEFTGIEVRRKESEKTDDESRKRSGIKFAHYIVNGEKLVNWFPAEGILTKKIYANKQCYVRIARLGKKRLVFDRHSIVIVVWGAAMMAVAAGILFSYDLAALEIF